jgi:hypothetical protein
VSLVDDATLVRMVRSMTVCSGAETTCCPDGLSRACRAVIPVPAMVGSVLSILVLFGWMGRWEGLVLLVWLAG